MPAVSGLTRWYARETGGRGCWVCEGKLDAGSRFLGAPNLRDGGGTGASPANPNGPLRRHRLNLGDIYPGLHVLSRVHLL